MDKSEMMEQIRKIETALSVELPEVVVRYFFQKEIICEYLDYLDMLTYAISMYVQIEDYDSAEYCISRCLSIRNDLKRVEAGTSELGRMIDDKPELELPAEYADYIDMLQSMMGT